MIESLSHPQFTTGFGGTLYKYWAERRPMQLQTTTSDFWTFCTIFRDLSRILVHFRSQICSDSKTNDIGLIKVGKVVLHAGFLTGVEYNRANIIATKRENL